jgi:hypothetical protein
MLRREPGMMSITTHIPPAATAASACSLDKGERAGRQAEWAELRSSARLAEHRTATTLTTTWRRADHVRGEVERLVAAEHECCPFFGFELTVGDEAITLVTTFPEGLSPASWEW